MGDRPKALLIPDLLYRLEPDVARRLTEKVLEKAGEQTTGQLRARLRRLVLAADPDPFRKRAAETLKDRRVEVSLGEDNLASIAGY